jgi:hypothetical protein
MRSRCSGFWAFLVLGSAVVSGCGGGTGGSVPANPPGSSNPAPGPSTSAPSPSPTPTQTPSAASANYVPVFQSSFSYAGKTYPYSMVGANPASLSTTTIPVEIVPVKLVFADGTVFDPAQVVSSLLTSPIFTTASFAAGITQYGDAQMRSEFWQNAANSNYHVLLAAPQVFPAVTENVPSADGSVVTQPDGTKLGEVTFNWFMNTVQVQLIQQLGLKPTSVAFFSTADTRVLEPGSSTATYGGYHDTFHLTTSSGSATFATIWGAMFSSNTRDVTHVGHEVVEWLNDPFYPSNSNIVPSWTNPGTTVCNSSLLEVADPVTLKLFTVNGYTFEDAAFLSWFSRQSPSSAIQGQYDLLNVLTSPASSC